MKRILREWRVEILLVVGLVLAAFLLLEGMDIRSTVWQGLNRVLDAAGDAIMSFLGRVTATAMSDLLGLMLVIGVIILAGWRLRWRLRRSPSLISRVCPRCGKPLLRVHRKPFDRLINKIIVPVHRYGCSREQC